MQRSICLMGLASAALLACDARVNESYRGEPLLSITGSLLIEKAQVSPDLVPALAFMDRQLTMHILDVDTQGEFPTKFTINVMLPPPSAGLLSAPELPSFALGFITALPADHGPTVQIPESGGGGSTSWCEGPDETDCYRLLDHCNAAGDACYHELARCRVRATEGPEFKREDCPEILEQSGDPAIANGWEKFAGLSQNYFVLYVAGDVPAGGARDYLSVPPGTLLATVFGHEPISKGYHLIRTDVLSQAERQANDQCRQAAEQRALVRLSALQEASLRPPNDVAPPLGPMSENSTDPLDLTRLTDQEAFDAGCFNRRGLSYQRLTTNDPVEITIGTRDLRVAF